MKLLIALAAGASLAGAALFPGMLDRLAPISVPAVTYVTEPARVGTLRQTVTATGILQAVSTVEVSSQLSGQIAALSVDFNDAVRRGDVLARLDRRGFEARVAQARAERDMADETIGILEARRERAAAREAEAVITRSVFRARVARAEAERAAAERRRDRALRLAGRGAATAAAVEDAETGLLAAEATRAESEGLAAAHERAVASSIAARREAEAELAHARAALPLGDAALRLAELDLERSVIRAPIDGVVIGRNVEMGQTVAATLDAPVLFTIAGDLSALEIHADVDETDIGAIAMGQTARFSVDAFPGERFPARVREIRKAARRVQAVASYAVVLEAENPDGKLLPGMTSTVEVTIAEAEPALTISLAALGYAGPDGRGGAAGSAIWVLDPAGQPRAVPVTPILDDGQRLSVRAAGLRDGDAVILREVPAPGSKPWEGIL